MELKEELAMVSQKALITHFHMENNCHQLSNFRYCIKNTTAVCLPNYKFLFLLYKEHKQQITTKITHKNQL